MFAGIRYFWRERLTDFGRFTVKWVGVSVSTSVLVAYEGRHDCKNTREICMYLRDIRSYIVPKNIAYVDHKILGERSYYTYRTHNLRKILNSCGFGINDLKYIQELNAQCMDLVIVDMRDFPNLRKANLNANNIKEIDISENKILEELNIAKNKLNTLNAYYQNNLIKFDMSDNDLFIVDKSIKNNMPNLEYLNINNNCITNGKDMFGDKIKYLYLSNNKITNIEFLQTLPNLKEVNISGNPITEIPDLSGCEKLRTLNIQNTKFKPFPKTYLPTSLKKLIN